MKIIMSKYLSGISPITVCCLNINKLENKCGLEQKRYYVKYFAIISIFYFYV